MQLETIPVNGSGCIRDGRQKEKILINLPNALTLLRIAIVPVFVGFFNDPTPSRSFLAGVFFVIASLTDLLDGYLARKRGEITVLGKLLDPVADKLLVISALIMLVDYGQVSAIAVILIITREIFVTGLRAVASSSGAVIAADTLGKQKLIFQIVAISFIIFSFSIKFIPFLQEAGIALLWISILLAIVSGVQYFMQLVHVISRS